MGGGDWALGVEPLLLHSERRQLWWCGHLVRKPADYQRNWVINPFWPGNLSGSPSRSERVLLDIQPRISGT